MKALGASNKYGGEMVSKRSWGGIVADVIIYGILVIILACCIIPFWHVLMASFSEAKKIAFGNGLVGGIAWWPIGTPTLAGYTYIFEDGSIFRGFLNTIIYMVVATCFGMIVNVTGGYVMSRKSKLKSVLTVFVMFTAMFNGGMLPTYTVIHSLGMTDTMWAIFIPGCTNAFFVIMISNALAGVPESTVEAAELDGAGHLRIMWQIMLPQAMTLVTVVILNSLVLQWNAWVGASIYLSSSVQDLWPMQLVIKELNAISETFMSYVGKSSYDLYLIRYAVIILGMLPMLIMFPFFEKKMERGVIAGAVKG